MVAIATTVITPRHRLRSATGTLAFPGSTTERRPLKRISPHEPRMLRHRSRSPKPRPKGAPVDRAGEVVGLIRGEQLSEAVNHEGGRTGGRHRQAKRCVRRFLTYTSTSHAIGQHGKAGVPHRPPVMSTLFWKTRRPPSMSPKKIPTSRVQTGI